MHIKKYQLGFTLIEIAVGLVIIGLVLGGVLSLYTKQTNANKYRETQNRLETIKEAILGYTLTNNRLPCPDTDNDGVQDSDLPNDPVNGTFCQSAGGGNVFDGIVPYTTLGVPAGDAWGNNIRYVVSGQNGGANFNDALAVGENASFNFASNGDIDVDDYNGNRIATGIPVLIMSHGKNGIRVWAGACNAGNVPDPQERENCDGDEVFVSDSYRGTASEPIYDDIVEWIPVTVLKAKMLEAQILP